MKSIVFVRALALSLGLLWLSSGAVHAQGPDLNRLLGESVDRDQEAEDAMDAAAARLATTIENQINGYFPMSQHLSFDQANCTITVKKNIRFVAGGDFTDPANRADFEALRDRMIATVRTYLNRKVKLTMQPRGTAECPCQEVHIVFEVAVVESGGYAVTLLGNEHGRGNVSTIYELGQETEAQVPDVYLAHEMAHLLLSADDEYQDDRYPDRTVFTDNSLMGDFYSEGVAAAEIKPRHFAYVRDWLRGQYPDCIVEATPE